MKKNPQTKVRQKRVLASVKTKSPRRRREWGLIVLPFLCCLPLLSNAHFAKHHTGINELSRSENPGNDTPQATTVIRGVVKDKEGTPLPGVTIWLPCEFQRFAVLCCQITLSDKRHNNS